MAPVLGMSPSDLLDEIAADASPGNPSSNRKADKWLREGGDRPKLRKFTQFLKPTQPRW
jgi:hypothetical protein